MNKQINKPLLIVFDHQIFSLQKNGGISRYIFNLYEELNKLGVKAIIKVKWSENVYLCNKKTLPKWLPWRIRQLSYLFLNQLDDYLHPICNIDILHFSYYGNTPLSKHAMKTAITVFDMNHEKGLIIPSFFDSTISNKRENIKKNNLIICISESTKNELLDLFPDLPSKKIEVVYLGADLTSSGKSAVIKFHKNIQFILYVGNRGSYKNLFPYLLAIKSFLIVKNIHIVTFGGGSYSQDEKIIIKGLGITALSHQVSGNDELLNSYYQKALFLVYPSISEGFGSPIIEAFSTGCPVLTSNRSSMKEIAGKYATLMNPFDKEDMLIKTLEAFNKSNRRKKTSEKLIKYASKFTWENTAKKTLAVYTSM